MLRDSEEDAKFAGKPPLLLQQWMMQTACGGFGQKLEAPALIAKRESELETGRGAATTHPIALRHL